MAEPSAIAVTFTDASFGDRIRLDSITCVVDAEQVFAVPEQMQLKLWQIGFADMLVLNKVDLVSRDQIKKIKEWLDEHFHRYRLIETTHGKVPLEILLSAGRFDATEFESGRRAANDTCREPGCSDDSHTGHHNAETFDTWNYETDTQLSLETLRAVVTKLPADVYRAKGIVYSAEAPERRAVMQLIGKRVDISLQDIWGNRTPYTRIVVIGAAGTFNEAELRSRFDSCRASH